MSEVFAHALSQPPLSLSSLPLALNEIGREVGRHYS